ncbi:MAG: DNA gyrase inhibitor YacG [Pseudomonadota bacterium]
MSKQKTQISCPCCGKTLEWKAQSRWKPFCSERCRLIDLGEWLNESNCISEPINELPGQPTDIS